MSEPEYIWIRNWERFQHYRDRNPLWIKNYTELLDDDQYLQLSEHRATMLHRLWLEFARSRCRLLLDTATLSRQLHVKVTRPDLEALNHAGFIEILASSVLAARYQVASARARPRARGEKEVEVETPNPSQSEGNQESLRDNGKTPRLNPRARGTNPRAVAKAERQQANAERFARQALAGDDKWPESSLLDELMTTFHLAESDAAALIVAHRPAGEVVDRPIREDDDW